MIIKHSGGTAARDPFVTYYQGYYWHCFTHADEIYISKAESVDKLVSTEGVKVYSPEPDTVWSHHLWAPELHIIDGKCYIYVACDDGNNRTHRMYVLYNDSADPQQPYKNNGKITDPTDKWAIDATILHHGGKMYFVWSGWEGEENIGQNIYIAQMSDPFTICSERAALSRPEYDWERKGSGGPKKLAPINEGPCSLERNGKVCIVYSASGSWCNDYCLGLLELVGDDVMDPACWKKHSGPVFSKSETVKGPGHCSIITGTPHGDWLFYHAFDEDSSFGWNSCSAYAQTFTWDNDLPVFGTPIK